MSRLWNSGASSRAEDVALLLERCAQPAGGLRVLAVQAREQMPGADEAAEQAEAVEAAGKRAMRRRPMRSRPFPVGARRGIEMAAQVAVVGFDVCWRLASAKKARKPHSRAGAERRELQLVEGDVRRVEVDGDDALRIAGEIAQHVAAARGDGDDARLRG